MAFLLMSINLDLVSVELLKSLDFDQLLSGVEERECLAYYTELSRLTRDEVHWSPGQLECIRFVGALLMMGLRSSDANQPYGPMFEFGGDRSFIPDDFPKDFLSPLNDWVYGLADPELRARLLDVFWLRLRARPAVEGAVIAYVQSALRLEHPRHWPPCLERIERALRLSASLGKGGSELKAHVLDEMESMIKRHKGTDPHFLSFRLINLLLEFNHGDIKEFASYALTAAEAASARKDFWSSKDYFELLADCDRRFGDAEGEAQARRRAAESLVLESEKAKHDGRGPTAATSILSDAVEAMRQVPGGKVRAAELHDELLDLQRVAVTQLKRISTDSFDISELVSTAVGAVRGKVFSDAVLAFCQLHKSAAIEKLKRDVHDQGRIAVFASLFSSEVMDSRGRVVARAPGLKAGTDDLKDDGLRWRMFRSARMMRGLAVQAFLNPARQEIVKAGPPDRHDILTLVQHSPWIPPGHMESVLRGLMSGFQGDMLVAAHIIPAQMEALIRHVVEMNGGTTSMLQPGGLQPEHPLSTLLETSQAKAAFGDDQVFELQDLLVDKLGTNLRNEVAHGILNDEGFFGTEVMYAWWLMLKFCVLTSKLGEKRQFG
jgi:Domain of unknown function (DUF4209)